MRTSTSSTCAARHTWLVCVWRNTYEEVICSWSALGHPHFHIFSYGCALRRRSPIPSTFSRVSHRYDGTDNARSTSLRTTQQYDRIRQFDDDSWRQRRAAIERIADMPNQARWAQTINANPRSEVQHHLQPRTHAHTHAHMHTRTHRTHRTHRIALHARAHARMHRMHVRKRAHAHTRTDGSHRCTDGG